MKLILPIAIALAVASCDTPEEIEGKRQEINRNLPPGCELRDAGRYRGITVIAVICDGRKSTSISWEERHGKSTDYYSVFWVGR